MITVIRDSVEYVKAEVTVDDDPTGATVHIGLRHGASTTWIAATLGAVTANGDGSYSATPRTTSPVIFGIADFPQRRYDLLCKVGDSPETPIAFCGRLAIDGATEAGGSAPVVFLLDVTEYGADRTGATSSVVAVEAALAAANTLGGSVEVYFPRGTYDLSAGITTTILANHVHITGGGVGVTTLQGDTGTMFTWGDDDTMPIGGGLRDCAVIYESPVAGSRVAHVYRGSTQTFERLMVDSVHQLVRLGESSTATAAAPTIRSIRGNTDPQAGSVVIDARFGSALVVEDVFLSAKGVGFPADTTSAHPANDTTFLRFGQGSWDTAHVSDVISNRYNRGLDISLDSAVIVANLWLTNCVWDYCKTHGIRLRTNHSGANIRSAYFNGGWAVATDNYSVEVLGTLGVLKNVHFSDVVARQAGKCNWRLSGGVMDRVRLTACHSLGANRLAATNTGTDQDDLVILGSGVSVVGGSYGEEGGSYTGFTCQGRYGVSRAADIAVQVTDVTADGVTGGFLATTDTAADRRRVITRNRRLTNALPEYATTAAVTAPSSGALQTHLGGTYDTLYFYDGTVSAIAHNSTTVATVTGATLNLRPGDTWSVTYSAAPTIKRIVGP